MLTEQNIKLFKKLGLPIYDEDADVEIPFEENEEEKSKEDIYAYIRLFASAMVEMGAGPYTVFTFKEQCNNYARRGAGWKMYYGLCCKYAERLMRYPAQYKGRNLLKREEPERIGVWGL